MVKIKKQNENNRIKVFTTNTSGNINTHNTTDIIAQGLAKDWAVKMDGLVDNIDYSSKYYAAQAKSYKDAAQLYSQIAINKANEAKNYAEQAGDIVSQNMVSATSERLGGIKVGSNLSITSGGVLNTNASLLGVYEKGETDTLLASKLNSSDLPSNVSSFYNDAGYQTSTQVSNSISSSVENLSNRNLSNLSLTGEARLHALKAYSDNGELLTDADGLSFVKNYAHSTFDRSKFTVVGYPVITDDGIASGFSSTSYLSILKNINFSSANRWEINIEYTSTTTDGATYVPITLYNSSLNRNVLFIKRYYKVSDVLMYDNSNTNITTHRVSDTVEAGISNIIQLKYNNNTFSFEFNGEKIGEDVLSELKLGDIDTIILGNRGTQKTFPFTGSIDLKQFSITVDGVEVFSGNKTGIDTIKPDNYTVAGTPTISADGVASGFGNNTYLKSNATVNFTSDSVLRIKGKIKTPASVPTANSCWLNIYNNTTSANIGFGIIYSNATNVSFNVGSGTATFNYDTNTEYELDITITASQVTVKYKKATDTEYTTLAPVTVSNNFVGNLVFGIGGLYNNGYSWVGNFDLNAFKVYVDGNLVYQPCLKIPYTESKTGSKIVQSIYRDRVSDMYEQFGFAPYYTLSDTDFTLPQGEMYGMIERKVDIDLSNMNASQSAINTVVNWGMPDYANGISVQSANSSANAYTAPCDGFINCEYLSIGTTDNLPRIDGNTIGSYNTTGIADNVSFFISKGQTFYCTGMYTQKGTMSNVFYPLKGVK